MAGPLETLARVTGRLREVGALVGRAQRAVRGVDLPDLARGASLLERLKRGLPADGNRLVVVHDVMGTVTDLSRNRARADRVFKTLFGDRASLDGLVMTMTDRLPGVRVRRVEITELLGVTTLHLDYVDSEGRPVGTQWKQFRMAPQARWVADDGRLEIPPKNRQAGLGTRLFANIIRWCWVTGCMTEDRFIAEKLGVVAWSRDEGIHVSPKTLADLKGRVIDLNRRFTLGLDLGRVERIATLQEVARLVLGSDPPAGLIDLLGETYRRLDVVHDRAELTRRARRVGDVALLQGPYEAFIDLRPGSTDAPLFLASVDRRLAERGR